MLLPREEYLVRGKWMDKESGLRQQSEVEGGRVMEAGRGTNTLVPPGGPEAVVVAVSVLAPPSRPTL